jgi:hypothetical protein
MALAAVFYIVFVSCFANHTNSRFSADIQITVTADCIASLISNLSDFGKNCVEGICFKNYKFDQIFSSTDFSNRLTSRITRPTKIILWDCKKLSYLKS